MKTLLRFLLLCSFAAAPLLAADNTVQKERIQSSYFLAFGRAASDGEINYWLQQGSRSIADLILQHRNFLSRDANQHRATIARSYNDALGRNPNASEYAHWMQGNDPYVQLVKNHVQWLAGNPAEYEKVIRSSYTFVFNRAPNAGELAYWKSQGALSYLVLIGCHADWKQRNGSSAPKTSGAPTLSTSAPFIASSRISPQVAIEARSASGIVAAGGGNIVAAGGGNIVAAGGGNIVAAGGGNIVAAGGGN